MSDAQILFHLFDAVELAMVDERLTAKQRDAVLDELLLYLTDLFENAALADRIWHKLVRAIAQRHQLTRH